MASSQPLNELSQAILAQIPPGSRKSHLELLLAHITVYLNRVFHVLTANDYQLPPHSSFSHQQQPLSYELAYELDYRLNLIRSYRLHNPDRVVELLTAGLQLFSQMKLNRRQVRFIQYLNANPQQGTMAIAKALETSSRTINQERATLFSNYGLRVVTVLNPPKFQLAHYGIFFKGPTLEESQHFKQWLTEQHHLDHTLPFLTGAAFDVDQMNGFFALYVPDQVQSLKQFHRTIEWIQKAFSVNLEIHQIQGFFTNLNFDYYDYVTQQWKISPDLHTEAALRFIEAHGSQSIPLRGFSYQGPPMTFHQLDWLLATTTGEGLLTKSEQHALLHAYGFPLAQKTLWTHFQQLKRQEAYFPYLAFSRLAFEDLLCFHIQCEKPTLDVLQQLFAQFPLTHLFPTSAGAIIFVGISSGGPSFIKQLTRTLLTIPTLTEITTLRFKRNLPLLPSLQRYTLWRADKGFWKLPPPVHTQA